MSDKAQLPEDIMRQTVDEIFRKYDTDKNGTLEVNELIYVVRDIFKAK